MKKYYLTNHNKLLLGSIWLSPLLIIIPLCILFYSVMPGTTWLFISILVMGTEILSAVYRVYSEHLMLSENGITYDTALNKTKATWSDVEKISPFVWWFFKTDGLFVSEPEFKSKTFSFSSFLDKSWLNKKRFIPTGIFSENWRESELGEQIKQHAPHLFEKEKSA